MCIHKNPFCLIWKSNGNSFNEVIKKELKPTFKVGDNVLSEKHVKSFVKQEYKSKKFQSPITSIVVNDLETYSKDRAIPSCSCISKINKICGKNHRDRTEKDFQKCSNDCVVFNASDSFNEILDHVLAFEGENKSVKIKIVEYNLFLVAHNGSGFDSYVVWNNLPQWRSVVKLIEIGAGNFSPKKFNGYVIENKKFLKMNILEMRKFILLNVWKN